MSVARARRGRRASGSWSPRRRRRSVRSAYAAREPGRRGAGRARAGHRQRARQRVTRWPPPPGGAGFHATRWSSTPHPPPRTSSARRPAPSCRTSRAGSWSARPTGGRVRDGVFAVGEVVGTPLDSAAIERGGRVAKGSDRPRTRGARGSRRRALSPRRARRTSPSRPRPPRRRRPRGGAASPAPRPCRPAARPPPRRRSRAWPPRSTRAPARGAGRAP